MRIQLRHTGSDTFSWGLGRSWDDRPGFYNIKLGRYFLAIRPGKWSWDLVDFSFGKSQRRQSDFYRQLNDYQERELYITAARLGIPWDDFSEIEYLEADGHSHKAYINKRTNEGFSTIEYLPMTFVIGDNGYYIRSDNWMWKWDPEKRKNVKVVDAANSTAGN